jgi:hypothetical protein
MLESTLTRSRVRWSAVALGLSAFLLALFPLVRPYFPMDPTQPAVTLAGAASAVTSAACLLAHALATVGFILLLCGLPALYASLSGEAGEPAALRALVLSGTGVALVLPASRRDRGEADCRKGRILGRPDADPEGSGGRVADFRRARRCEREERRDGDQGGANPRAARRALPRRANAQ